MALFFKNGEFEASYTHLYLRRVEVRLSLFILLSLRIGFSKTVLRVLRQQYLYAVLWRYG